MRVYVHSSLYLLDSDSLSWICFTLWNSVSDTSLSSRIVSFSNYFLCSSSIEETQPRMRPPSSLKHEFVKKWIVGLQRCSFSKKNMSILERKNAIKLSADIAMASVRNGMTCWSRALISNASKHSSDYHLVEQILGPEPGSNKPAMANKAPTRRTSVCKKIVKRSCRVRRMRRRKCVAAAPATALNSSIVKHLVRKRTQVLKNLIPGGEFMNENCLIEETLDYITSLRIQVDVMRSLAAGASVPASE